MAAHDKALIIDSLSNAWSQQASPAMGATCVATQTAVRPTDRITLNSLGWSAYNKGAAYTATLSVRAQSIAGTVLAAWDMLVGSGASVQDNWAVNIKAPKGNNLVVEFGTPGASVTYKVSPAGWIDSMSDG